MIVESLSVAVQLQQSNSHATGNRRIGKWARLTIPPLRPALRAWHLLSRVFDDQR
jgi:hypothetical protein